MLKNIIIFLFLICFSSTVYCSTTSHSKWQKGYLESSIPEAGTIQVEFAFIEKGNESILNSLSIVIQGKKIDVPMSFFKGISNINMDKLRLDYEFSQHWEGALIILVFNYNQICYSPYCSEESRISLAFNKNKIAFLAISTPVQGGGSTTRHYHCAGVFTRFCP